jgi:hypothetical protein
MRVSDAMTVIFSYGSNSVNQLRGRLRSPNLIAHPAHVENWSRIFCLKAPHWGDGGVASLAPHPGAKTLGSIVNLNENELAILDSFEGGYRRQEIDVVLSATNESLKSNVYIAVDPAWLKPPSEEYLTAIHVMLREQHRDICAIPVNRWREEGAVETVYDWYYPGPRKLSLASLVVEVNAMRRVPWKMPLAIEEMLHKMNAHNVRNTADLIDLLHSPYETERLDRNISDDFAIDDDTITLFRNVLGIQYIPSALKSV